MISLIHKRRYSLFLFSFLMMLFGDIFISSEWDNDAKTILMIQNMLFSLLLFKTSEKLKKIFVMLLIGLGAAFAIYQQFNPEIRGYLFVVIFMLYFVLISYQLFNDLVHQEGIGIETISAVFSGYILLGTVSSIVFAVMDSFGAFRGPENIITYPDYLYFSFVTLLTIGYGDIVPVTEISKKAIILLGLMGHFYTVFVVGIVIGKFLKAQESTKSDT